MDKKRLWLLFLIFIATALRLTLLGDQSLWYDEGVTWLLTRMGNPVELIEWTAADIQPPLYYLLLWNSTRLFGDSEWALRFPSVIFNLMTLPLIYVLARRLFKPFSSLRSVTPLLATVLFAGSPLMITYSQEARMYTMLVFEATLTAYLLLKILHPNNASQPVWPFSLLYALVATAALYTHYFALFLLIAHLTYTAFILWQGGWPKTMIRRIGQIFGLTVLLFLPWLPTLLSRLGDDPSYWPGSLKLNEAGRKILISFTVGETVLEQTGFWLALGYLAILLLGSLGALVRLRTGRLMKPVVCRRTPQRHRDASATHIGHDNMGNSDPQKTNRAGHNPEPATPARSPSAVAFNRHYALLLLLLWLLLPPGLILLLSYQSPKFNPRYTMLAWPAFLLLLATALVALRPAQRATTSRVRPASRLTFLVSSLLFTVALLFVLASFAFSLTNWFTDPRFAKDDFKALAQFVRERIAEEEAVLLSSGHLFPVWAYYYGWNNWTPLPRMERLDVERVTDLSIAAEMAPTLADKKGVWLVTWQNEVIDPNGVVPFWLDLIGHRPGDAGDFWGVGLEHWQLDPEKIKLLYQNPIQQPLAFNFADQVTLEGLTQLSNTKLALFWRPRQPLPSNLVLTLDLSDEEGFDWGRESSVSQPGSPFYPPARWPVGRIVMTRHQLAWRTGTPPGDYLAKVELGQTERDAGSQAGFVGWDILDSQGRPQRRTALVEPLTLSELVRPPGGPPPPAPDPLLDFRPVVTVQRSSLSPKTAQPGDRILLALWWQAGNRNNDDLSLLFDLSDSQGQTLRLGSSPTPSREFSLPRWKPGDLVLGQYWLDIPAEAAAGPATLQLHLINRDPNPYDQLFPIDRLEILPTDRIFRPPAAVDIPLQADFSGQVSLIGVDCPAGGPGQEETASAEPVCRTVAGQPTTLTFYWQAGAGLDKNYTVFTHLLGPEETVLLNADHAPPKATRGWVPGEIIADTVTLPIPADLPPGQYALEVGLYDAADPTFPRLPLTNGESRLILPRPVIVE